MSARGLGLRASLLLLIALAAVGCATDSSEIVQRYCEYGAVSQAQLDGCLDHVDEETVDRYNTAAASFARRERTDCGSTAGPFCRPHE